MEVIGQFHTTAALPPGKESLVIIWYESGWAPEPIWTKCKRENSLPYRDTNSDPSNVQPVASRYTDYALLASWEYNRMIKNVEYNKKLQKVRIWKTLVEYLTIAKCLIYLKINFISGNNFHTKCAKSRTRFKTFFTLIRLFKTWTNSWELSRLLCCSPRYVGFRKATVAGLLPTPRSFRNASINRGIRFARFCPCYDRVLLARDTSLMKAKAAQLRCISLQ
jgi:hypothetical protein